MYFDQSMSTVEADLMQAQWVAVREGARQAMAAAAEEREAAVRQATGDGLEGLAALKAALPQTVDLGKLVALVDVSGSMYGTPMEVAIALGLLVSELAAPTFRDRVLTFETTPSWVDLSGCSTVLQKVATVQRAPWGGSTNFEAACEQILQAAEGARLRPDDIPDLLVLSDMQFDQAGGLRGAWETHYERLARRFAEVGRRVCGTPYAAPRIIFWNLRGGTVGFPVQADAPNTQMLSGFSPSLLKLVLGGKDLVGDEKEVRTADGQVKVVREGPTPAETVQQALHDSAFDAVRIALTSVGKGPLAEYAFHKDDFEFVAMD